MEDDHEHEAQLPEQTPRQDQPSEGQEKITCYAQARAQPARQEGLASVEATLITCAQRLLLTPRGCYPSVVH